MKNLFTWFIALSLFAALAVIVAAAGCSKKNEGVTDIGGEAGHSGTYYVIFGVAPRWNLELEQDGTDASFTLNGPQGTFTGTGTFSGDSLHLTGDWGGVVTISFQLAFTENGDTLVGLWEASGDLRARGTVFGTKAAWQTYDIDAHGIPQFATSDCIELSKIARVSRFRSGEGHDYSDDFESCRSMKHYYFPKDGVDRHSVKIYSPVSGVVICTTDEWDGDLWKGTAVNIRPFGYEAFDVALYHMNPTDTLFVGDTVWADQQIGTSQKEDGTVTDMVVGLHVPAGYKYISFFQAITDDVFHRYELRGASSRDEFIITKEDRDADPLTCNGQQFTDSGHIENWVYLN